MKNVLHLCKCNVQGGAEYSSDIIYDGGAIDCIPDLVGENLSVVLERIGGFVCGLGIQVITTNEFEPSNEFGKDGDIHIREQEESIDLYQKLNGEWALIGSFPIGGGGGGVGDFVTINTDQFGLTGTREWQGRHYFENTLAIPREAPIDPLPNKAYIYVGPGSGAIPPEAFGNLEDLQNVADTIPVNKFLFKGLDGIWVGVDVPGQDLSAYASKVWVGDNFYSKEISDGLFVTQATDQFDMPGNKGWTGRHHFDGDLAIPLAAPIAPDPTKAYIYVGEGSGATPPSGSGNLEDLQNVDDVIANNKFLYKGSDGIWVGVDAPTPTNVVTTNTSQIGLFGDKETAGVWTFGSSSAAKVIMRSQDGVGNNYIQFRDDLNNITGYVGHGSSSNDSMIIARTTGGYISISDDGTLVSQLSGSGTRIVTALANGVLSAQDYPELYIQPAVAGGIGITGGNLVYLDSLSRVTVTGAFDTWANTFGGFRSFNAVGVSGLSVANGAGFYVKRSGALNSSGSWGIYASSGTDDKLYYVYGTSTSGTHANRTIASEEWVNGYGLGATQASLMGTFNDFKVSDVNIMRIFRVTTGRPGTYFSLPHDGGAATRRTNLFGISQGRVYIGWKNGENAEPTWNELWTTDNMPAGLQANGMILERYRDPSFVFGNNNLTPYPNSTGTVVARIADSTSPTGVAIRYTATGWAEANVRITFAGMLTQTAANKAFIVKIIAKIPTGWEIFDNHNSIGSGGSRTWLTPKLGTGDYTEYIFKLVSGASGTFSLGNYFDLRKSEAATPNPSAANPVVSYIAFATVFETTESYINTRIRIPTTPPEYPLPGDLWIA